MTIDKAKEAATLLERLGHMQDALDEVKRCIGIKLEFIELNQKGAHHIITSERGNDYAMYISFLEVGLADKIREIEEEIGRL